VRETLRVLKPGSMFALIAETYRGGPLRFRYGMVMPLLRAAFLSDAEHRDPLAHAGFTEVATKHVSGKNWICAGSHARIAVLGRISWTNAVPAVKFLCMGNLRSNCSRNSNRCGWFGRVISTEFPKNTSQELP
jgi:hypothetical protein